MKKHSFILLTALLTFSIWIIQSPEYARAASPDAIENLISTSHTEDVPSKTTTIDMQWTVPDGYTGYFYTLFSSEYTQYTLDEDTSGNDGVNNVEEGIDNYSHSGNDTSYYFFIVPVWMNDDFDEEYGPTSTFGPIIIDTTSPTGSVTISPNPTTSVNVTLELTTDDAIKMHVSNVAAGDGSEMDFSTSIPWELEEGEGEKTVYVQLKDVAGNTLNISDSVTVSEKSAPQITKESQQYVNDSTKISAGFSIIDAEGGLLTLSTASNLTMTAGDTFSVTGLGWFANGNNYCITATAGETIPLTFVLNELPLESLAPDTITITVTDSTNLSATHTLSVYLKGDVDGDGEVELTDVEKAFYFNAGIYAYSELEGYIVNTNDDGETISFEDFKGVFYLYMGIGF
jgi:hypothetical protein